MSFDIRSVRSADDLIRYFAEELRWDIDLDDFEDIDDITYDFEAADVGLKEEAFAKISSLKQLPPLVDEQKWGVFCVEFDSNRFEVSALRKILSGLVPKRRNAAEHAVWAQKDLLFLCFWGKDNNRTIGIAHFEDKDTGLPQIKMISCAPAVEDFTQINNFTEKLKHLTWVKDTKDTELWHKLWSEAFTTAYHQVIRDSASLTVKLAAEAQAIRDRILKIYEVESEDGYVHKLHKDFKESLIHDMTKQQFADMYAQTVVYGLFSARCMDKTQEDFSVQEAIDCIPETNPFLKSLMKECLGGGSDRKLSFDELEVANVVDILLHTNTDQILLDFNRQTGGGKEDPVSQFYEEFLTAYDKGQKVQRGVYYTPQPVVNFIVRAVDSILKTEFGLADGLASEEMKTVKYMRDSLRKNSQGLITQVEDTMEAPAVQILDPATGTGTFLRQTIIQIYENFKEKHKGESPEAIKKAWNEYVPKHLLPRLNGFELMMAPYAVAHMKLAMVLKDTGYDFGDSQRLNVFLTNSLEEAGKSDMQIRFEEDPLASESIEANAAKKNNGINVVIGNPPYSGESANKGEWIMKLMEDYKKEPGGIEKLQERNSKWINDDYVKFIRLSQLYLLRSDCGVLSYICPHGFIDNPTFRGMRWNLLQSFDKIYIIDLHGNSKKKEKTSEGQKDENVFDIQQGVCIFIAIRGARRIKNSCEVYHTDLFGLRERKYAYLLDGHIEQIEWNRIDYDEPYYLFKSREEDNLDEYERGFYINELFQQNSIGVVSARDDVVVDFTSEGVLNKISLFCDPRYTDQEIRDRFFPDKKVGTYLAGDTRGWSLSNARKKIMNNNHCNLIQRFLYRPFDCRYIYYTKDMVDWSREQVMKHFIDHENVALIAPRQTKDHIGCFISECICGHKTCSAYDVNTIFPLYIYSSEYGSTMRVPNLNNDILKSISKALSISYIADSNGGKKDSFAPIDLFDYIYAVLHSPIYRKNYKEFLKIEFPRVPYPTDKEVFWKLVALGSELRECHLMKKVYDTSAYTLSDGSHEVVKPEYKDGKVYISKTQYFDNVPQAQWEQYIGGYQPLQKWLKDRKKTVLTDEEVEHYKKIIAALKRTEEIMAEIDQVVEF